MDKTKIAELEVAAAAAKTAAEAAGGTDDALNKAQTDAEAALATAKTSSDPVATELDAEKNRAKRTEADKAEFTLRKQAERAKTLGLDPAKILGITATADTVLDDDDDDSKPMTRGDWKREEANRASKTALEMANEITDENERNLTIEYLGRVKPSGNPTEDLRFARMAVNGVKSGLILEEVGRRGKPAGHSSGSGGPAASGGDSGTFVPTANEAALMKPPFNLTQADVIKARAATK